MVLSVMSVGPVASTGSAATAVDSCRVIDEPGTYELTRDLQVDDESKPYCIQITASDVTFDGNGHLIHGNYTNAYEGVSTATSSGVYVTGDGTLENVTVSNLTVEQWRFGVRAVDIEDATLTGITARDNRWMGLNLTEFDGGLVADATVTGTKKTAIRLRGNDTVVRSAVISDSAGRSGRGQSLDAAGTNLTVADSRMMNNNDGPSVSGDGATFRNNTVTTDDGLQVRGTNARVVGNDVTYDGSLIGTVKVAGADAVVSDNRFDGVDVGPVGPDIAITENTFVRSSIGDIIDDNDVETTDLTVSDNTFEESGVAVAAENSTVSDNTFSGESFTTGAHVIIEGEFITVRDNAMTDPDTGVLVLGESATVTGNDVSGAAEAGVTVGNDIVEGSSATVADNTVTGATDGVRVDTVENVTITGNELRGNGDGVHVVDQQSTEYVNCTEQVEEADAAVQIHRNAIVDNSEFGVHNEDEAIVNATGNYWGAANGPSSNSSDPDAPFADPYTGTLADGSGDAVSEGPVDGESNVHFDGSLSASPL